APRSQWRRRYAGWPALKKLEVVDEMMRELRGVTPAGRTRRTGESLPTLSQTLREHYHAKQAHQASDRPTISDRDLQRLFAGPALGTAAAPGRGTELAEAYIRRHRAELRRMVTRFTGESQFTLEQVLEDVLERCRVLELRALRNDSRLKVDLALLLTART